MSTCRKYESKSLEQLLWVDGKGVEAFLSASLPFAGTRTGFVSGSAQGTGPHVETPWTVRTCGFKTQGGSGFALPPRLGVHLSELASEQMIEDKRPNNNSKQKNTFFFFFPLFVCKGTCLNRKRSETWLGLSLLGLLLYKIYPLRVARSWQSDWMQKKQKEEKKVF